VNMRLLLQLYFSYVKAGILSMVAATVVFYAYAVIVTGKISLFTTGILILLFTLFLLVPLTITYSLTRKGVFHFFITNYFNDTATQFKEKGELEKELSSEIKLEPVEDLDLGDDIQQQKKIITDDVLDLSDAEDLTDEPRPNLSQTEGLIDNPQSTEEDDLANSNLTENTETLDLIIGRNVTAISAVRRAVSPLSPTNIKIIGVGGGGSNAVNRMIDAQLKGVQFIAVNTDLQALKQSKAPVKLQLGIKTTEGLGAGADPEVGRQSALEDQKRIVEVLKDADMVFITAGLGGGTGSGAAPVIGKLAKGLGMLTVAVVTLPFKFEGAVRKRQAEQAIKDLHKSVDTVIAIHNERLLSIVEETTTFTDSFELADEVLRQAVQGISDIIAIPGLINVDFADVKTIMGEMGTAVMGIGMAEGKNRAVKATKQSIQSPLLEETSIKGAKGLLVNVTGRADLTLFEVNQTMSIINDLADPDANIIFGAVLDENLREEIKVTVIATGFPNTFVDSSDSSKDQSINNPKDSKVVTFRKRAAG